MTALKTVLLAFAIVAFCAAACDAECKLDDDCAYAARSMPLNPATVGEALDAQRAVDVACRAYRACIRREQEALDNPPPDPVKLSPEAEATIAAFWKRQAEKEKAAAAAGANK